MIGRVARVRKTTVVGPHRVGAEVTVLQHAGKVVVTRRGVVLATTVEDGGQKWFRVKLEGSWWPRWFTGTDTEERS